MPKTRLRFFMRGELPGIAAILAAMMRSRYIFSQGVAPR